MTILMILMMIMIIRMIAILNMCFCIGLATCLFAYTRSGNIFGSGNMFPLYPTLAAGYLGQWFRLGLSNTSLATQAGSLARASYLGRWLSQG